MDVHRFILTVLFILVEFRVANLETVEIRLGTRNVILPLDGPVHVKRIKPAEMANLKIKIPELVNLVEKVRGYPSSPSPPPPRPSAPPDRGEPPPRYQPSTHYSLCNLRSQYPIYYSSPQTINILINHEQPSNTHHSEYAQHENHRSQVPSKRKSPLPYRGLTNTNSDPKQTTHRESHGKAKASSTSNGNHQSTHISAPHLETNQPVNITYPHNNTFNPQSPPRQHSEKHFDQDNNTSEHSHSNVNYHNPSSIASHDTHYGLPPNTSSGLNSHKNQESNNSQVENIEPLTNNIRPIDATLAHRLWPLYAQKDTPPDPDIPTPAEDPETSHTTAILDEDTINSQPTSILKQNTTLKIDVVTSNPTLILNEDATTPCPSTVLYDIAETEHSKESAETSHSLTSQEEDAQEIFDHVPGDVPAEDAYVKDPIRKKVTTSYPGSDASVHTVTDVLALNTLKESYKKDPIIDVSTTSSLKLEKTVKIYDNVPDTLPINSIPESNVKDVTDSTTKNLATSSSEHETAYAPDAYHIGSHIQDSSTDITPVSFFPEYDRTANDQDIYNYIKMESHNGDLTIDVPAISSEHEITTGFQVMHDQVSTNTPSPITLTDGYDKDPTLDSPITPSNRHDVTEIFQTIHTDFTTNASGLKVTMESDVNNPITDSSTASLDHETTNNAQNIYSHISTLIPTLNAITESYNTYSISHDTTNAQVLTNTSTNSHIQLTPDDPAIFLFEDGRTDILQDSYSHRATDAPEPETRANTQEIQTYISTKAPTRSTAELHTRDVTVDFSTKTSSGEYNETTDTSGIHTATESRVRATESHVEATVRASNTFAVRPRGRGTILKQLASSPLPRNHTNKTVAVAARKKTRRPCRRRRRRPGAPGQRRRRRRRRRRTTRASTTTTAHPGASSTPGLSSSTVRNAPSNSTV